MGNAILVPKLLLGNVYLVPHAAPNSLTKKPHSNKNTIFYITKKLPITPLLIMNN